MWTGGVKDEGVLYEFNVSLEGEGVGNKGFLVLTIANENEVLVAYPLSLLSIARLLIRTYILRLT